MIYWFNFLICVVEFSIMTEAIGCFLRPKKIKCPAKKYDILIAAVLLYLFNQLEILWANPMVSILLLTAIATKIFQDTFSSKLLMSFLAVSTSVILEFVALYLTSLLMGDRAMMVLTQGYQTGFLMTTVVSKTLLLFVARLLKIYTDHNSRPSKYRYSVVFLFPMISLFTMYTLLYFDYWIPHYSFHSFWMSCVAFLLIIGNGIVFYLYDGNQEVRDLRANLITARKKQQEQEELLSSNTDHLHDLAALTHDYKNQLITVQSMVGSDRPELSTYLEDLTGEYAIKISEIQPYTNNTGLNGILNCKMKECERLKIKLDLQIDYGDLDFLSYSAACCIFGNLLDNAITACKQAMDVGGEGSIHLSITRQKKNVAIYMVNTRSPRIPIISTASGLITTKIDRIHHGLGIYNLEKSLAKYHGRPYFRYTDHHFYCTIWIKAEE